MTIKQIEKNIVERGFTEGWIQPEPPKQSTGKRSPSSDPDLRAWRRHSSCNGRATAVTVYEKADRIGGLLRYGIPNFKLEKHIVDRRVEQMAAEGVQFVTNAHVGVKRAGRRAATEFDAIVLAGGAEQPRDLKVPGRELKGIHFAMEFLPQQNRRCLGDALDPEQDILATGQARRHHRRRRHGCRLLGNSAIDKSRSPCISSRSCPSLPRTGLRRPRGHFGRCNCAPKARMKKAAFATGASRQPASAAIRTAM